EDIRESKRLLEDISGQKVQMFRAPSWSITPDRYEVLRILTEEGFTVDSSLQPFATPLSGIAGSPIAPFHPQLSADEPPLDLVEFPPTVWQKAGVTMPFSGGFYLRAVPYPLVRWALKQVNREREGMVYLHPWELDANQPRVQASPLIRLAQYYRLRSTKPKVERLLQEFTFVPLGEILEGRTFPATLLTKGVQGPRHG
ncbi:MAG TPA: DUF3473 domain-containing protein, partial [Bacilli bacterium]|nr:DUF3473 domain-containing protein [Bacilli bacterium]